MTALADGMHDIPAGKLATVTTYLEMTAPPVAASVPAPDGVEVAAVAAPEVAWYRAIYRRVGAPWLWCGRLETSDAELAALLRHPDHLTLALTRTGDDLGFAEIDFGRAGEAEIVYFGLVPEATGAGLGRRLMTAALDAAWRRPGTGRVWLHSCDLDDPRAIGFYRRMGFAAYARKVEVLDDPRLTGRLPRDCAPQVPLLAPLTQS